jgi:hypothetical protein
VCLMTSIFLAIPAGVRKSSLPLSDIVPQVYTCATHRHSPYRPHTEVTDTSLACAALRRFLCGLATV